MMVLKRFLLSILLFYFFVSISYCFPYIGSWYVGRNYDYVRAYSGYHYAVNYLDYNVDGDYLSSVNNNHWPFRNSVNFFFFDKTYDEYWAVSSLTAKYSDTSSPSYWNSVHFSKSDYYSPVRLFFPWIFCWYDDCQVWLYQSFEDRSTVLRYDDNYPGYDYNIRYLTWADLIVYTSWSYYDDNWISSAYSVGRYVFNFFYDKSWKKLYVYNLTWAKPIYRGITYVDASITSSYVYNIPSSWIVSNIYFMNCGNRVSLRSSIDKIGSVYPVVFYFIDTNTSTPYSLIFSGDVGSITTWILYTDWDYVLLYTWNIDLSAFNEPVWIDSIKKNWGKFDIKIVGFDNSYNLTSVVLSYKPSIVSWYPTFTSFSWFNNWDNNWSSSSDGSSSNSCSSVFDFTGGVEIPLTGWDGYIGWSYCMYDGDKVGCYSPDWLEKWKIDYAIYSIPSKYSDYLVDSYSVPDDWEFVSNGKIMLRFNDWDWNYTWVIVVPDVNSSCFDSSLYGWDSSWNTDYWNISWDANAILQSSWVINFSSYLPSCPISTSWNILDFSIGGWSLFGLKVPEYKPLSSYACLFSLFEWSLDYSGSGPVLVISWRNVIPSSYRGNLNDYSWPSLGDVLIWFIVFSIVSWFVLNSKSD